MSVEDNFVKFRSAFPVAFEPFIYRVFGLFSSRFGKAALPTNDELPTQKGPIFSILALIIGTSLHKIFAGFTVQNHRGLQVRLRAYSTRTTPIHNSVSLNRIKIRLSREFMAI